MPREAGGEMNKQGPGRIDWTDWTWNPVTGCRHNCWFCAAARMARRFPEKFNNNEPTLHGRRLKEPLAGKVKPGARIFVCFQGDLLGKWAPATWTNLILDTVRQRPDCTFQFLTRNPDRYREFEWPENTWLGTSAATAPEAKNVAVLLASAPRDRIRWANIAPCLEIEPVQVGLANLRALDWIAIEPLTGRTKRNRLQSEENVRYWKNRWRQDFPRVPVFVKGMRTAWDNNPQAFPADRFKDQAAGA